MDAVIVYESAFGNTGAIAHQIAEGLRTADPQASVHVVPVTEATDQTTRGTDLLVVGGPTHMLSMSRASSRRRAIEIRKQSHSSMDIGADGDEGSVTMGAPEDPGVREWLATVAPAEGCRAAAFTTKMSWPISGSAARPIARRLRHRGYAMAARPAAFIVEGSQSSLRAGEMERAKVWGAQLARSETPTPHEAH